MIIWAHFWREFLKQLAEKSAKPWVATCLRLNLAANSPDQRKPLWSRCPAASCPCAWPLSLYCTRDAACHTGGPVSDGIATKTSLESVDGSTTRGQIRKGRRTFAPQSLCAAHKWGLWACRCPRWARSARLSTACLHTLPKAPLEHPEKAWGRDLL